MERLNPRFKQAESTTTKKKKKKRTRIRVRRGEDSTLGSEKTLDTLDKCSYTLRNKAGSMRKWRGNVITRKLYVKVPQE